MFGLKWIICYYRLCSLIS